MSSNPPIDVAQQIDKLERRQLDRFHPPATPIWGQLDATPFMRVAALTRFWEVDESTRFEQYMEDLVTAFYGQSLAWAFLIVGEVTGVNIYVGAQSTAVDANTAQSILQSTLLGSFPGITLALPADPKIGSYLNRKQMFAHLGRMSGIPTLKTAPVEERLQEGQVQQIERLVRALHGSDWGYFVFARPTDENSITGLAQRGLENIKTYAAQVKRTVSLGPNLQGEQTDRQAQYLVELLEKNLARLNRGKAQGMWQTETYFFAPTPLTLAKVRALLRAIYAGADSVPDPIRTYTCVPVASSATQPDALMTLLNSRELATLTQLPKEEFPGYAIKDYARFDVALDTTNVLSPETAITVGKIVDHGVPTGNWYAFPRGDLAKHGLIVGVTGSGKTNTIFHLLSQVWNSGKGQPFLVIEPAKAEYRDLRTVPGIESLRIYTLGDERYAPFRLNPFEFEIADGENRVHVQTHIDYLKSVFNASFVLYAPMPYVLERCLHEIYQDKGWDLTTSQNRRVPPNAPNAVQQWNIFPTLTDLYYKIDEVTDSLGYEERIQMDVKAGLKARIESLRLGGKGLMLDTPRSVSMDDLLKYPTVLELERVGDDEEKAFLMGLLMTRIYEYRVVQAKCIAKLPPIQHITVIEEAHRLLKNVPTEVSTDSSNVKGKAVETFANMLSEIRAYGEGVLIAEQIPTKLAPDAIKNTNLKILHRVVAEDDRQAVGATMNLVEEQLRAVTTFARGQAAVYAEGNDHPFLVEVVAFKQNVLKKHLDDAQVREAMNGILLRSPFDTQTRDAALRVMQHAEFRERFTRYIHSLLSEPAMAVKGYPTWKKSIGQVVHVKTSTEEQLIARCVMTEALSLWFADKGRRYDWFYNATDTVRQQLEAIVVQVVGEYTNNADAIKKLQDALAPRIAQFQHNYLDLCKRAPLPFEGCHTCAAKCVYRFDIEPFAAEPALHREFTGAIQNAKSDDEMWNQLAAHALDVGARLVNTDNAKDAHAAALCYVTQMGPRLNFSRASQRKLVKNVNAVLGGKV